MDFTAFETILGYLAGFTAVCFSLSLLTTPPREGQSANPVWFALVVATIGLGFGMHSPLFFAMAPALFTPLIESFLPEKLSRFFKVEILAFTFLFVAFSDLTNTPFTAYWKFAFCFYLLSLAIYFYIAADTRSLLRRCAGLSAFAISVFILIQSAQLMLPPSTHDSVFRQSLGTNIAIFGFLIVLHSFTLSVLSLTPFHLIQQLKRLIAYGVFSVVASGLLTLSEAALLTETQFYTATLLLFALLLVGVTFFTLINRAATQKFALIENLRQLAVNQKSFRDLEYDPDQKQI
jgi:hypothetical protein